jgi:hypothetical protein
VAVEFLMLTVIVMAHLTVTIAAVKTLPRLLLVNVDVVLQTWTVIVMVSWTAMIAAAVILSKLNLASVDVELQTPTLMAMEHLTAWNRQPHHLSIQLAQPTVLT